MAARVCPYCRELNSVTEKRCYRCGRALPGPVAEGAARIVRQVLGGEAPVTRLIIGLELVAFSLALLADRSFPLGLGDSFRLSTMLRFGALAGELGELEPWRMLSAVFVHVGILHVGMNLFTHADLGRVLEGALGGARFGLVFLLSGFLGFLASEVWYGFSGPPTAGASGGVFGEIGAVVGILYARRDPEWKRALTRYLIFAVLLGIALPVNNPAHFGGFFAGIVLGYGFHKELQLLRLHRLTLALFGLGVAASIASVALSATSPVWKQVRAHEQLRE